MTFSLPSPPPEYYLYVHLLPLPPLSHYDPNCHRKYSSPLSFMSHKISFPQTYTLCDEETFMPHNCVTKNTHFHFSFFWTREKNSTDSAATYCVGLSSNLFKRESQDIKVTVKYYISTHMCSQLCVSTYYASSFHLLLLLSCYNSD